MSIYSTDTYKGFRKYFHQIVSEAALRAMKSAREEDIEKITDGAFKELCTLYGGLTIYIPFLRSDSYNARNKLIMQEFNGTNHLELARKYGVSLQTIYKCLEKARKNKNA